MEDPTILALASMIIGALFGVFCVLNGVDHFIAFSIAAGIFGVAGYELKTLIEKRKKPPEG